MTKYKRPVTVHQLPAHFEIGQRLLFLEELRTHAEFERPRLVLDCSKVECMDDATAHLLLCCLEEGMKRNGDVRLAALHPDVEAALHETGLNQLFEVFATLATAINSYHVPFAFTAAAAANRAEREDESAA